MNEVQSGTSDTDLCLKPFQMQQHCRAAGLSQANLERRMWICMWDWLKQCPIAKVASGLAFFFRWPFDPRRPHLFTGCLRIDPSCHDTVAFLQGRRWLSVVCVNTEKTDLMLPFWSTKDITAHQPQHAHLLMFKGKQKLTNCCEFKQVKIYSKPTSVPQKPLACCLCPPTTPPLRAVAKRLH